MKFGFKPSNGNFGITPVDDFVQTSNLVSISNLNTADRYIIDTSGVPTHDQGNLSSCGAHSTVTALEILHYLSTKKYEALAPMFTYYCARVPTATIGNDDGSFIHDNFNSLETLGVCSLNMWNTTKYSSTPSILAFKEANDNKISAFRHLYRQGNGRLEDIEMCVRANLPVVFGTSVSNLFTRYMGEDHVFDFPKDNEIVGQHAMVIVGVRNNNSKKEFMLLNSWGNWGKTVNGKPGFCWISEDYITNNKSSDFFVADYFRDLLK